MSTVVKIDEEVISAEQFVKILKLTNEFPEMIRKIVRDKVTVHAAKKKGIAIPTPEVQQMADDFRRCGGLHRAKDTQEWMDGIGISLDEFESFITEQLYKKRMLETIVTDKSVEAYFKLNSPKFDSVDIRHIVVEGEEKAKELIALIEEEPESFDELVKEHSLDEETKENGGLIKGVLRGALSSDVDAKIFNAAEGVILGPFRLDEDLCEIILIAAKKTAKLDDSTKTKIGELLYDEWLAARVKEHAVTT